MDVCALGELLIDFSLMGSDAEGYPALQAHPGGAPANFLGALSALGAETALIGTVGEDAFGRLLCESLERAGISREGISLSEEAFTTLAFVTLDKKGEREFSFARKPGADTCLSLRASDYALIEKSRVFHFGSLSLTRDSVRLATEAAVGFAKKCGKLISYDPNYRPPLWKSPGEAKERMLWGLAQADIIKISDNEAEFLFSLKPEEAAEHIINNFPARLVFVSCGEKGCIAKNKLACCAIPALKGLNTVDSTGAGDIFFGAAMWKILRSGKEPGELSEAELREITAFGNAAAGLSTEKPGGLSSLPSYENIIKKLNK